jgi:hypothetical protein
MSDREQRDLEREVAHLREQVAAFESSRWWRLHPRFALQPRRERSKAKQTEPRPPPAGALPDDFAEIHVELWNRVAPYTMTSPGRVEVLARSVEYVVTRSIAGAFVECGVWRGGSMMAVALTLLRLGVTDRELFLFDTFEGMTEPGAEDVKQGGVPASEVLQRTGSDSSHWAVASLEKVQEAFSGVDYPRERLHFVAGKVEDTLPAEAPEEVALLRLDTDWYASTKHELVHLYPRLARNGVLIIDDYAYWRGARQAVDEYVAENEPGLLLIRIDHGARVAIKP